MPIRTVVWGENIHERTNATVAALYPHGMHEAIADLLRHDAGLSVSTATMQQPEHGLPQPRLDETDVLLWWGHKDHGGVADAIVERVVKRVWEGMGLIVLHSAHFSKIFKRLMGSPCALKWREAGERERLWVTAPQHPIARGLPQYFELETEEMYGEHFDIPAPDELVMVSWFKGGEIFRSGCCFYRGHGKIFYFRPGHETHPTYFQPEVRHVIANGTRWAAPTRSFAFTYGGGKTPNVKVPLESLG